MIPTENFLFPDLSSRSCRDELMDDPQCNTELLLRTVTQFQLINALFSRHRALAKKYLVPPSFRKHDRPFTIVDIGSGGGDFARMISRWAQRMGFAVHITCVDYDKRISDFARKQCASYTNISVENCDVRDLISSGRTFDGVYANHFLHHFSDSEIPDLLKALHALSRHTVLINDLKRSRLSIVGYAFFAFLFARRSFAFTDGIRSIHRGFTRDELVSHIAKSGLKNHLYARGAFPGRLFVYKM